MRPDMDKQITECYRYKYRFSGSKRRDQRIGLEDLPSKVSMRRSSGGEFDFGENLSPLYRFLNSSVGRPWDAVYSEICSGISTNSTIGAHVIQHVWDRVELNCYEEDGKVFRSDGKELSSMSWRFQDLYVAQDGILKALKSNKARLEKLYDLCLRSEDVDFRYDYYRKKGKKWQKAVLYRPDQKVDRGRSQRVVPVIYSSYSGQLVVLNEARVLLKKSLYGYDVYGDPIYDWVYAWKTLSSKEVSRLGLDTQKSFHEVPPRGKPNRDPLEEGEFREILKQRKDEEKNYAER